jgi:amino acid transporter
MAEPLQAEQVAQKSAVFKKELGLADLVLTQVLFIVGLPWIGVAAKQGPSHVVLWLLASVLFYLPSAVVVIHLNREMPLEGGLYQWAKLGFNEAIGFLVAWNLWLFAILNSSEIGLQVTQYFGYLFGPRADALVAAPWFVGLADLVLIGGLVALTTVGLGVGKWVHKASGALLLVTFAAILLLPWLQRARGILPRFEPLPLAAPAFSVLTLNLLAKMGFGAFGGFEYVAIHAGECRDPARSIARSVRYAVPIIGAMFILGTSSMLALVPQDKTDLIAPIPQVLSVGFAPLGVPGVAPLVILALLCVRIGQSSVMFAGNTRLPMVTGWDRLLPEWFTRLHARYRTPVNSIVFVGAVTLVLGVLGLVGVGKQEAFQLLWVSSGVFYALAYVALFCVPLFGRRGKAAPRWIRVAAVSGLAMTLLSIAFSIVPLVEVESRLLFAAKISGLIVLTNAIGTAIFFGARHRGRASA